MPEPHWITLQGRVKKGFRVASGPSKAYPEYGSIEKQKPYFKKLGLNLELTFNGTLNISIHPYQFKMVNPQYTFRRVKWTELTNAETFSFSRCKIKFQGKEYDGWVYYPHPETKREHFQDASTVEVLAPFIPNVKYRNVVEITFNAREIEITKQDRPGTQRRVNRKRPLVRSNRQPQVTQDAAQPHHPRRDKPRRAREPAR